MRYVQLVLDVIEYEEMKVNRIFLRKIDDFNAKCQRVLKVCNLIYLKQSEKLFKNITYNL